jgi:hypothetical protein
MYLDAEISDHLDIALLFKTKKYALRRQNNKHIVQLQYSGTIRLRATRPRTYFRRATLGQYTPKTKEDHTVYT